MTPTAPPPNPTTAWGEFFQAMSIARLRLFKHITTEQKPAGRPIGRPMLGRIVKCRACRRRFEEKAMQLGTCLECRLTGAKP